MNHLIFVGGVFTPAIQDNIVSCSKNCIQYAADTLQKCYIEGLASLGCDLEIFNLPYIGNYPKLSTISRFKADNEQYSIANRLIQCRNISFNNLILYKNWSRYRHLKRELIVWCKKNKSSNLVIIVYAAHTPFMKAVAEVRAKFKNVRSILIVPDLPEFMGQKASLFHKAAGIFNSTLANNLYQSFDGYIFLSQQMSERISVDKKEYEVIEGIYSSQNSEGQEIKASESDTLRITYTGTLAQRYGVMNLVRAFQKIKNNNIELDIIGEGDARCLIEQAAKEDKRIKRLGQMAREKALEIQRKSAILVNPRTSEGEFTKYSFPSKTMEYLASGIPCIINKLPGIPKEYFEYSFQPKDESIDSLAECLEMVLSLSPKEREEIGKRARDFILQNKTPMAQCKKLMKLIDRLKF